METDLHDALIAWQGGELPPGRADELLARLRADADFRRAFAEEVWTLSLTRIAQAADPRWLALYEELGLATATADESGEEKLMSRIRREPVRFVNAWWQWATYGSMAAAAVVTLTFVLWTFRSPHPAAKLPTLAVLIQAENPVWQRAEFQHFTAGSALTAGPLQLASGRVSVMFTNGVTLDFEGPADLDLLAVDRLVCRQGRLRTKVPQGAEGFCVETPRGTVTDLGTELGISVSHDGKTHVAVFEGKAEVSLQIPGQEGVRTALLTAQQSAELLPGTGEIRTESREGFLAAANLHFPQLPLPPQYAGIIAAAKPLHHWRLDRIQDGAVSNEVSAAPSLQIAGGVGIKPDEFGRTTAFFPGKGAPGALYLAEPWSRPAKAHAIEFWFATNGTEIMSLAALTAAENEKNHILLLELGSRRPGRNPEPGVVRYLTRWPASDRGGLNIFSPPKAFPYRWHHLVAQQDEGELQLFIDGEPAGTAHADKFPRGVQCALQFGGLKFRTGGNPEKIARPFAGRLAEIAIYGRLLTPAEIQQHAALSRAR